jgi:Raf kinase inhibitor-like YbhB/YbcL family protein
VLALAAAGCSQPARRPPEGPLTLTLTSPAFAEKGSIPSKYTCDGPGVSPPLAWSGVPAGAKSLALIVDDPDAPDPKAPKTTWVHWVVYDLPPSTSSLPESASSSGLPAGARQGKNDWGNSEYGAACPPVGRHRYVHKLYALDTMFPNLDSPAKSDLEGAMQGHVLARGELIGTYEKGR